MWKNETGEACIFPNILSVLVVEDLLERLVFPGWVLHTVSKEFPIFQISNPVDILTFTSRHLNSHIDTRSRRRLLPFIGVH
ncbi:hypothetical protein L2E82_33553 [Cichorium intybus]|uniref:Uncharacterized protein n=1 Tax=Cichorium intybus TaxID=13427 RepID=A0ACB9BKU7_CICIN|nr:hypothetical protein L2E82_33553 [Cichorium intybus]